MHCAEIMVDTGVVMVQLRPSQQLVDLNSDSMRMSEPFLDLKIHQF